MSQGRFDPLDYVSVVRRRKWWLIVPLLLCTIGGAVAAWFWPREYQANAVVAIESPRVSTNLVPGARPLDKQERLRAISQQLLSEPVLTRVVKDLGLGGQRPLEETLAAMRKSVDVSPSQSIAPRSGSSDTLSSDARDRLESFSITYAASSPARAQQVANSLAAAFVSESTRSQALRAEDTSAFIGAQLEASQSRLDTLEEQLRTAKEAHMGSLPEQTDANLRMLSGLQQQLQSTSMAIRSEQDRLTVIERQIDEARAVVRQPASQAGAADPASGSAKLAALERQLAEARLLYTSRHPEIQRLEGEVAAARQEAAAVAAQPEENRLAALEASPAYRQLQRDAERARLRIAELQRAEAEATRRVAEYRSRVESAPRVEQQLRSLQRAYDLERQQYGSLAEKHRESVIAEELARQQGGERFHVQYPAEMPRRPTSPNVPRFMLMALLLGVFLGGAAVVGREYLDRAIYDARTLQEEFGVPVLAEIPSVERYRRAS